MRRCRLRLGPRFRWRCCGGRRFGWLGLVVMWVRRFPSAVAAVANSEQASAKALKVGVETSRSCHCLTKGVLESSSGFGWWGMSSSGQGMSWEEWGLGSCVPGKVYGAHELWFSGGGSDVTRGTEVGGGEGTRVGGCGGGGARTGGSCGICWR